MDSWPNIRRRALAFVAGVLLAVLILLAWYAWPDRAAGQVDQVEQVDDQVVEQVDPQQAAPYVRASWQGAPLVVEFGGVGCLYMAGGNRPATLLELDGQNFCNMEAAIRIPTGGIDAAYVPQLRTHVVLRQNGIDLAVAVIPPRVVLPIVIRPPTP